MRKKIGFVFQYFNLFMHLTAIDNVLIGLLKVKRLPKEEALKIGEDSLKLVGINKELWAHYPAQLSGGQQQRVAIARAIAMSPRIILFDEPTSALDVELISEVLNTMRVLAEHGMTMLIVTHELEFARSIAQEIMFLDSGIVMEKGHQKKLLKNQEAKDLRNS